MHTFVPKSRKPRFDLTLQIHDLNNVPLVSGAAYVKWHLHNTTKGEARGRTDKAQIKDHKVTWKYERTVPSIRMTIDRNGVLHEQLVMFEIWQEYNGRERITLGTVTVNLAEYAGVAKETRRYLMQDSKINSTLKITIAMKLTSGDVPYSVPNLKGARVFGGIAGIIGNGDSQQTSQKKDLDIISLASRSRELGAKQDMYRCTLAASWQLQAGELNAEECIEDIFAGGDGWVSNKTPVEPTSKAGSSASSIASRPFSAVSGWWSPQRAPSIGGESMMTQHILNNSQKEPTTAKVIVAEGSSDSDTQSAGTGGSGASIAERRRLMRTATRDADVKSLAGSDRRRPWGIERIDTGLEVLGGPLTGNMPMKTGRKLSECNTLRPTTELNAKGEVDERSAREDLKSWGRIR